VSIVHIQINTVQQNRESMLKLHKRSPRTPQEQESLQREIVLVDEEIDKRVYILYGLTEEEIKIVDGR